jgi:hypothetical protein
VGLFIASMSKMDRLPLWPVGSDSPRGSDFVMRVGITHP